MRIISKFLVFMIISVCSASSTLFGQINTFGSSSLYFSAVVPEDYGVVFPSDVLFLDSLCFEYMENGISGQLVNAEGEINIDYLHGMNTFSVNLLYYGNLSHDYNVELVVGDSTGWIGEDNSYIPVDIKFGEYTGNNGIESRTTTVAGDSLNIKVPAVGPRRGEKVGNIIFSWENDMDLQPGIYKLDVNFVLRSAE